MSALRLTSIIAGVFVMSAAHTATDVQFTNALLSQERSQSIRPEDDLYGGLIGTWDVRVVDRLADGSTVESQGEWLFERVLEGRAIQDVFITPRRPRDNANKPDRNRYGASLRMFDPVRHQWKVVWMNPVTARKDELWGHYENGVIVQDGFRSDGQPIRWSFRSVTAESFHWVGEARQANGSWVIEAEFFGTRKR